MPGLPSHSVCVQQACLSQVLVMKVSSAAEMPVLMCVGPDTDTE